jgi:hypothetical protein
MAFSTADASPYVGVGGRYRVGGAEWKMGWGGYFEDGGRMREGRVLLEEEVGSEVSRI